MILGRLLVLTFAVPHLSMVSARAHHDVLVLGAQGDVQLQAAQGVQQAEGDGQLGSSLAATQPAQVSCGPHPAGQHETAIGAQGDVRLHRARGVQRAAGDEQLGPLRAARAEQQGPDDGCPLPEQAPGDLHFPQAQDVPQDEGLAPEEIEELQMDEEVTVISYLCADQTTRVEEDLITTYEDCFEHPAEHEGDLPCQRATVCRGDHNESHCEEGWIRRGGVWRHGTDRWHNRNGSLKPPLANKPARPTTSGISSASSSQQTWPTPSSSSSASAAPSSSATQRVYEPRVLPSGYVVRPFDITRPSPPLQPQVPGPDAEPAPVGFWSRGVFIPRERTPAELRSHTGGQGRQRQERRARRVQDWKEGKWKPSWLVQYQKDKESRERARQQRGEPATSSTSGVVLSRGVSWGPEAFGPNRVRAVYDDDVVLGGGLSSWGEPDFLSAPSSTTSTSPTTTTSLSISAVYDDDVVLGGGFSFWGEPDFLGAPYSTNSTISPTTTASSSTTSPTTTTPSPTAVPTVSMLAPTSGATRSEATMEDMEENFEDELVLMQMTNNEEADLRQLRMSEFQLQRLQAMMDGLADHQEAGRGPHSRWALACMMRRAFHAQDLVELLLRVLQRRLQPQGYWPIVRVPRDRSRAGGLYGWARHFGQIVTQCVEECMQLPLDENDFAEPDQLQPLRTSSSSEVLDSGSSQNLDSSGTSSSARRTRSRSPTPRRHRSSSETPHSDSEEGGFSNPPPPMRPPAEGELRGIWREPQSESEDLVDNSVVVTAVSGGSASANPTVDASSIPPAGSATIPVASEGDVEEDEDNSELQLSMGVTFTVLRTTTSLSGMNLEDEVWLMCTSSSTTTTTTSTTATVDVDSVRDAVNEQLVQGCLADTREVLRRLMARLRHLRRLQALVETAVEEALLWLQVSLRTRPWNARLQERMIWQAILRAGGERLGVAPSGGDMNHFGHVLLQPNLPDLSQARVMLPNTPSSAWGTMRRRLWQRHMAAVVGSGNVTTASSDEVPVGLYMLQVDDSVPVDVEGLENHAPPDISQPHAASGLMTRRRGHEPRRLRVSRLRHARGLRRRRHPGDPERRSHDDRESPPRREFGLGPSWRSPSERRTMERSRSRDL